MDNNLNNNIPIILELAGQVKEVKVEFLPLPRNGNLPGLTGSSPDDYLSR